MDRGAWWFIVHRIAKSQAQLCACSHTHTHKWKVSVSCSVISNSLWSHGLYPTRVLCPWNSPGMNTGVGCHSLLQRIFLTQGSNLGFPHKQADSLLSEPPRKHVCVCVCVYFHHYCFERKTRNYSKIKKNNRVPDELLTPFSHLAFYPL